jgi:hypothetical protein
MLIKKHPQLMGTPKIYKYDVYSLMHHNSISTKENTSLAKPLNSNSYQLNGAVSLEFLRWRR